MNEFELFIKLLVMASVIIGLPLFFILKYLRKNYKKDEAILKECKEKIINASTAEEIYKAEQFLYEQCLSDNKKYINIDRSLFEDFYELKGIVKGKKQMISKIETFQIKDIES